MANSRGRARSRWSRTARGRRTRCGCWKARTGRCTACPRPRLQGREGEAGGWVGLGQGLPAACRMQRLPRDGYASFSPWAADHASADHSDHTPCKGSHVWGSCTHPPARCSCRPPARASHRRRAGRLHRQGQGEELAQVSRATSGYSRALPRSTHSQPSHPARLVQHCAAAGCLRIPLPIRLTGAGLLGPGSGQRGDHVARSLSLPPGVHNGAAAVADHL